MLNDPRPSLPPALPPPSGTRSRWNPNAAQWARVEALDQARKWVTAITDKENDEIEKAFELIEMLALRWAELIETGDAE